MSLLLLICSFSKERKKLGIKLEGWRGEEAVEGDKGRDSDKNILYKKHFLAKTSWSSEKYTM